MRAEIISTGTELLLGKTLNTSAFYLTGQLSGLGIEVDYHITVGDNKERLLEAVRQALDRSEMIFLTGGLGPTADDMTKEIISLVFGLNMDFYSESLTHIQEFYKDKHVLPPGTEKQAFFPHGSIVLPNEFGTAPGAFVEKDGKYCVILPGPPSEMQPMFERYALPVIRGTIKSDRQRMFVRTLKIFGLGESELEQKISDLMKRSAPFLTLLDKHTYMNLRITIRDGNEDHAREVLENTEETIRQRLGHQVFAVDEETHSQVVGALLRQKNLTLASAESCTGGLLGGSVTAEAGSSDYFLGGVVSYANSAKEGLLGVKDLSLIQYGAVSKEVAEEMAEGARKVFGADLGISTTGIAGPGGATPEKPVGLVYIALAHRDGCIVEKKQFAGNRDSVRNMTVEAAMNMLRIFLLSKE
jgi:nicotinamide-nucleotide amidase